MRLTLADGTQNTFQAQVKVGGRSVVGMHADGNDICWVMAV